VVITPFGRPVVPERGDGVASGEKVGPGSRSLGRFAQDDDAFEVGQVFTPQRFDVVHAEKIPRGAQDPGAALAQHVAGLRPLEARVERDENGSGGLQADGRDDPLGDVGRPDADPVSGLDARGAERARGSQPRVRQLGEGEPDVFVFDGALLGVARGRRLHESGDRLLHGMGLIDCFVTAGLRSHRLGQPAARG
jgi:hypothetical protein